MLEKKTFLWSGPYGCGAMAAHRASKRREAEARNAQTAPENRRDAARKAGYSRHSDRPSVLERA